MDKKEFDGFSDEELEILQSYFDRIMFNLTGRNIGDMGFREMSKFKNCILDSKGGKGDICSD